MNFIHSKKTADYFYVKSTTKHKKEFENSYQKEKEKKEFENET